LAYHLKERFQLTLTDISPGMQANSQRVNPEAEHIEGLFARARWLQWFAEAGLTAHSEMDAYGRDVFIARPKGA